MRCLNVCRISAKRDTHESHYFVLSGSAAGNMVYIVSYYTTIYAYLAYKLLWTSEQYATSSYVGAII